MRTFNAPPAQQMKYRTFAALYEESTSGWVWLATPRVEPHRLVILRNEDPQSRHPVIYCEARSLDDNFITFYNSKPHTKKIDLNNYSHVLVIGDWYRQALGIPGTKIEVDLEVRQPKKQFWPALRAGSQHPDPTIRLANRLGLLGTWLGLVGLAGAVDPFIKATQGALNGNAQNLYSTGGWLLFIVVAGLVCAWGAQGVRRRWSSPYVQIQPEPPPKPPGLTGTRLVHYGPLWDEHLEGLRQQQQGPVAVLVCHGMGQQVRYQTISSVAEAIQTEADTLGGHVSAVEVHVSRLNDSFLARAEIKWTDRDLHDHAVHVYEAYWAPLTEGQVTYWDTIKFLFAAARNGLRYSVPFGPHTFHRWVFGGPKKMRIGRATFFGLIGVLTFLIAQVAAIGFVLAQLASEYKNVLAQPLPWVHLHQLTNWEGWRTLLYDWLRWLGPFFPGHSTLIHVEPFNRAWWSALVKLVGWFLLITEVLLARYFIIEYVGDVAAYISPYKDSKFDALRQKIQKVGLDVGKVVYGFGPTDFAVPHYDKIVVVGHSLGSVLAYDTLNALINLDNTSVPADQRDVVRRTRALLTFGSPLDKTAFIFRMQARDPQDWIRERLAASVQPLILDYARYRPIPPAVPPPGFEWFNIWSRMDIISGELNYYDDPSLPANRLPCCINQADPNARIPFVAHIQYWTNPLLRNQLYRFVTT